MSKKMQSALTGLVVAIFSALVSFGVLGGDEATTIQGVIVAAIAFGAAVGVRSALPPKE